MAEMETETVKIPKVQAEEIRRIMDDCPEFGYESVDEFVREAVRKSFISDY